MIFSDTCARYLREIQLTAPLPLIAWKMHDRPQLNRIIARSNNYPCTCPTAADDFRCYACVGVTNDWTMDVYANLNLLSIVK